VHTESPKKANHVLARSKTQSFVAFDILDD